MCFFSELPILNCTEGLSFREDCTKHAYENNHWTWRQDNIEFIENNTLSYLFLSLLSRYLLAFIYPFSRQLSPFSAKMVSESSVFFCWKICISIYYMLCMIHRTRYLFLNVTAMCINCRILFLVVYVEISILKCTQYSSVALVMLVKLKFFRLWLRTNQQWMCWIGNSNCIEF